jgi:hypothetical protein
MPSATFEEPERITKFTNCRLVKGDNLVEQDLWVSSITGKILRSQEEFYTKHTVPDRVIDLGGRIISPGLIDVQLNGAFGFNFSTVPGDLSSYGKTLRHVNKLLVRTGVTSYLPTLTSQKSEVYHKVRELYVLIQHLVLISIRFSLSLAPQARNDSQKTVLNLSVRTAKAPSSIRPKTASTPPKSSSTPLALQTSRPATAP